MRLLDQAHGVFIIPDYAQAGAIVGGEGGEGVVLLRQDDQAGGQWTAPAFFNFGGATFGAEVGVEAGSIAMLLMSDRAVEAFKTEDNNFSLDASAGLTIVDFSAKAEVSAGKGDVVVWSDTEGAFVGAAIGVSDINRDDDEIEAYYGPGADAEQVLSGSVSRDRAASLRDALS
jgi:lipid-binding SYLF domain-containing protein